MFINEGKIGQNEGIAILVTGITAKILLNYPAVIISHGGSGGWMVALLSGVVTGFFFIFIYKLVDRFPDKTFPEVLTEIAGNFASFFIILFVFLLPWLFTLGITVRRLGDLTIGVALPETPVELIMAVIILTEGVVVYTGINVIARACYISFPFTLLGVAVICLLTYPLWDVDWLFPLLGKGVDEILTHGLFHSSDFAELSFVYAVPLIFFPRQVKKVGFTAIGISTLIFTGIVFIYSLCFPSVVAEEPYVPIYIMSRSVYLSRFLQRIEIIFVIFWVIGGYLWLATGFYSLCYIFAVLFKLPDYRPLIIPTGLLIFTIALIPESAAQATYLVTGPFGEYAFVTNFGLPALLLFLAWIRKKGVRSNNGGI